MKPLPLLLAALAFPMVAVAGPVSDFESQYRAAYASYRAALFTTNSGDAEAAKKARTALDSQWRALIDTWEATPPPHYADDPGFPETLEQVARRIGEASDRIEAGNLPAAHEVLEGIREELGALHARNGIESFSDRMNAYHAEMEVVLSAGAGDLDGAAIAMLREKAAVLDYLARDLLSAPPPEAAGNAEYEAVAAPFAASVAALLEAARKGDPSTIKAALGGLKKPYSKLFLKFG